MLSTLNSSKQIHDHSLQIPTLTNKKLTPSKPDVVDNSWYCHVTVENSEVFYNFSHGPYLHFHPFR